MTWDWFFNGFNGQTVSNHLTFWSCSQPKGVNQILECLIAECFSPSKFTIEAVFDPAQCKALFGVDGAAAESYKCAQNIFKCDILFNADPSVSPLHRSSTISAIIEMIWLMGPKLVELGRILQVPLRQKSVNEIGYRFYNSPAPFHGNLVIAVPGDWAQHGFDAPRAKPVSPTENIIAFILPLACSFELNPPMNPHEDQNIGGLKYFPTINHCWSPDLFIFGDLRFSLSSQEVLDMMTQVQYLWVPIMKSNIRLTCSYLLLRSIYRDCDDEQKLDEWKRHALSVPFLQLHGANSLSPNLIFIRTPDHIPNLGQCGICGCQLRWRDLFQEHKPAPNNAIR